MLTRHQKQNFFCIFCFFFLCIHNSTFVYSHKFTKSDVNMLIIWDPCEFVTILNGVQIMFWICWHKRIPTNTSWFSHNWFSLKKTVTKNDIGIMMTPNKWRANDSYLCVFFFFFSLLFFPRLKNLMTVVRTRMLMNKTNLQMERKSEFSLTVNEHESLEATLLRTKQTMTKQEITHSKWYERNVDTRERTYTCQVNAKFMK